MLAFLSTRFSRELSIKGGYDHNITKAYTFFMLFAYRLFQIARGITAEHVHQLKEFL